MEVRNRFFRLSLAILKGTVDNLAEALYSLSLPGAIGMYGLSLGVQHMDEILPLPVYALLSGLNSSTVGIIALAAVQLADKAIKDKLTRILVILGAVAGLCYNALWYFPTLMAIGGLVAVVWDGWMHQKFRKIQARLSRRRRTHEAPSGEAGPDESIVLEEGVEAAPSALQRRVNASRAQTPSEAGSNRTQHSGNSNTLQPLGDLNHVIRLRIGIGLVVLFFGKVLIRSE